MNKAFTANINNQVTARGYLDENDQLIMLEPEGSGGGDSDFTTAKLTVVGAPTPPVVNTMDAACIAGDVLITQIALNPGSYDIVLYKGKYYADIDLDDYDLAGDAVFDSEAESVLITGDATLTYKGGE